MFSSRSPNYTKLRTHLKLCINRLKLLEKKKTELALKARREISEYIANGKDERARIRVEHIIREDYLVEAMEIVEMFCDLLVARMGLFQQMKELDPGLEECIATLLWVAPRLQVDVQEMKDVAHQLTLKYGKEYAEMCQRNGFENVHEKVIIKMSTQPPPKILIENYMIEIARAYNVPFEPDPAVMAAAEEGDSTVGDLIDIGGNDPRGGGPGAGAGGGGGYYPGGGSGGGGGGGSADPDWLPPKPGLLPPNNIPPYQMPEDPAPPYSSLPEVPPHHSAPVPSHPAMPLNPGHSAPVPGHNVPMPGHNVPGPGHAPVFTVPGAGPAGSVPVLPHLPDVPPIGAGSVGYPGPPPEPSPGRGPPPLPSHPPNAGSGTGLPNPVPPPGALPHPAAPSAPDGLPDLPEVPGLPSVPADSLRSGGGDDIDFDDLSRRFEELKKRK